MVEPMRWSILGLSIPLKIVSVFDFLLAQSIIKQMEKQLRQYYN
ncbi:hypothetical protein [Shewanella sp. SG41-4]|nr:hypothetical protein [Shewanella sp. SG41-4]